MSKSMTITQLQKAIGGIEHRQKTVEGCFYKLSEEVGELAKAIMKDERMLGNNIKGTIEEELYDVLYYVVRIANLYNVDLQQCIMLKEKINAEKYNRKSFLEEEK